MDPRVNSLNVVNLIFPFLVTLGFHLLKNTPRYLERLDDCLSTNAMLKLLLQNLPLFGCLFITAYGNESFLEGLSIAALTLLAAAIPSITTQKTLSCFPMPSNAMRNANLHNNPNEFEMDIIVDPKIHLASVKRKIAASNQQVPTATLAIDNPAPKDTNGYLPFNAVKYSSMLFKPITSNSSNIPSTSTAASARPSFN